MSEENDTFISPFGQGESPLPKKEPSPAILSTLSMPPLLPPLMNAEVVDLSKQEGEKIIEYSSNGRYAKLSSILGKGAYKIVYKAIDREEGYEVAWNCFQTTKAEYTELSQEIEILKRVRHPNIINFLDCWFNSSEFVFVTELMTSGTLRDYIRKLHLPNLKIVKRWCTQILKGLVYLHSHNPPIIHRDIKCDNIFINGAHGEVKIGDMGTAQMKMGKKYTVIGTPEFMAPEMYEEKGYSEKVDIYAFGMCLVEMITGEYPYSECKNAAQVYRKVTQGMKPDCLSKITNPDVIDLINNCICDEHHRLTASEVLEHPFLAVEPEVVLLPEGNNKSVLTLQVVFKGTDKLSVKFEFNLEYDTAEEVVNEMIEEQVLPSQYKQLITHEINRIIRDLNKLSTTDKDYNKEELTLWRREANHSHGIATELERTRQELQIATERALEAEKQAVMSEARARVAEEKTRAAIIVGESSYEDMESKLRRSSSMTDCEVVGLGREYDDELPIDTIVFDTAMITNRGMEKANEWLSKLKKQDIMLVGDLRELQDEDWAGLGLTVFAARALKNAISGKPVRVFGGPRPLQRTPTGTSLTNNSTNTSGVFLSEGEKPSNSNLE